MSDFSIPSEWLQIKLGEVIDYGKTEKIEPTKIANDTWVLELEDIEKDNSKIINRQTFAERQSKSTKNKFYKNDVLYGKLRPYLNKIVLADNDGVCTTEIIPLTGKGYINNKYLFYWLKGDVFGKYATMISYGLNMPRLGTKEGLNAPFILPPKAEQEKIAELLDSHLMQVENIKAQLNAIIPILKKFRQSVLADAVSGRLTNNLNLQTKKLKDITLSVSDGDHQSPPKSSNGVPFLVISDVSNGELNLEKASRFVPSDYFENLKDIRVPKSGDLLYTVTGSFGIPVIVHNDDKFCFQRHIAIIRPKKEQIDTSYLYYFLKSNLAFKQAVKTATGTAQKTVALSSLRNFDIILPTLKEQREIVERVEQLFAFADNINTQINNALQRVNHLTQSILHQAFTGQLTADWRAENSELITGDNSAEKLLEQIQAAKQAQTPVKKDKAKMHKTTKAKPEQGQLL